MNSEEIRKKEEIKSALAAMIEGDFLQTSKDLLEVLGYCSDRTANFPATAEDFIQRFPARNRNTETEAEFVDSVESVKLAFQVTNKEIAPDDQPRLFEAPTFNEGICKKFHLLCNRIERFGLPPRQICPIHTRGQQAAYNAGCGILSR